MANLDETGLAVLWDVFKEHSLTNETKAFWGMGISATPDDVFAFLGKYNQHWWKITDRSVTTGYKEVRTAITSDVNVTGYDYGEAPAEVAQTIKYATSITVDQSLGTITLNSAKSLSVSASNASTLASLAPIYVTNLNGDPTGIYYIPAGATAGEAAMSDIYTITSVILTTLASSAPIPAQLVTSKFWYSTTGSTEYVCSSNRSAYPDSGVSGTLAYEYLGVPFENISKDELVSLNTVCSLVSSSSLGFDGESLVTSSASGTYGCVSDGEIGDVNSAVINFSFENFPDTARICYMGGFTVSGGGGTGSSPTYTTTTVVKINGQYVSVGMTPGTPYSGNFSCGCNFAKVYGRPLRNTDSIEITVSVERTSSGGTNYRTCSGISSCVFQYINV